MKKIKFFLVVLVAGASCFLFFACGDGGEVFDASKNPPTPSISINHKVLRDVVQNSPINRMREIIKKCPTFYECHKGTIDKLRRVTELLNPSVEETTPIAPHLLGGSLTANSFLLFSSDLNK